MTPAVPEPVAALLRGGVRVDDDAQAFLFSTVDGEGFPHVALLSATELAVGLDGALLAAIASPTTRANVKRTGVAALLAVEGDTAHALKLRVRRVVDVEDMLGAVLDVVSHRPDSLGIPLRPITFTATAELRRLERWDITARVLAALAEVRRQA